MGADRIDGLTPRQLDCLRRVAAHDTTEQIADHFGISASTVEKHIAEIVRKLGVSSRKTAAKLMIEYDRSTGYKTTGEISPIDPGPSVAAASLPEPDERSRLRDVAAERDIDPVAAWTPTGTPDKGWTFNDLTILQRLVLIVAMTVLLAIVVIAIPPMVESYRSLANQIEPFHSN